MTDTAAGTGVRRFRPGDEVAIRALELASLAANPLPGVTPRDIEDSVVRIPPDPDGTAVALEDDRVVGACTPRFDSLTVHPEHRRRGHGRRLIEAGLEIVRARGLPSLQLYAPVHLPATRAFVEAVGLRYHSSLWQLRLGPNAAVPPPSFPPDVAVRGLRSDEDLERYVELLNTTFADHPTPVYWSVETVRHVHGLPEFDPSTILIVTPADDPDRLVAFTRLTRSTDAAGVPEGDIGLIGVRREWRGRGLGRELLRWGVTELRSGGARSITLSVEALNERALRIYRAAGFEPAVEWPHYVVPA